MKLTRNAVFTVNPAIELVHALDLLANEETFYKLLMSFDYTPPEAFSQTTGEMKSRLSRFLKKELQFFFRLRDMRDVLLRIIIEHEDIRLASDLIAFIGRIPEEELLSYIIRQALYGKKANSEGTSCWNSSGHMADSLKQLIYGMDNRTEEDKETLVECVENPSEAKSRLCFLLAQFYEKCYKPAEDGILAELSEAKASYEKLFQDDPDYFNAEYLGRILDSRDIRFIIHISYFMQVRTWGFDIEPYNSTQLVNLGVYSEHYPRETYVRAKVQKFAKILSDKKRFELIELLSKRAYYVSELSNELELTSPTVCYHLGPMLELNLVSLDRNNNKAYYSLNRDTIRELLKNAAEILLQED